MGGNASPEQSYEVVNRAPGVPADPRRPAGRRDRTIRDERCSGDEPRAVVDADRSDSLARTDRQRQRRGGDNPLDERPADTGRPDDGAGGDGPDEGAPVAGAGAGVRPSRVDHPNGAVLREPPLQQGVEIGVAAGLCRRPEHGGRDPDASLGDRGDLRPAGTVGMPGLGSEEGQPVEQVVGGLDDAPARRSSPAASSTMCG